GGADRNRTSWRAPRKRRSRPPCGGADRNDVEGLETDPAIVAPRAGARIETASCGALNRGLGVAPRAGARIETQISTAFLPKSCCRPPCGGADRNFGMRNVLRGGVLVAPRAG